MKSNSDFTIEGEFAVSLTNPKGVYQRTKLDGNQIFERKWFLENLNRYVKRVDVILAQDNKDVRAYKKLIRITDKETWQNVTVAEEMYQAQFGWDFRYKLVTL